MRKGLSKGIILIFAFSLGLGVLFKFGMKYFLKNTVGIESDGMNQMAENLPEEMSFVKWIIYGSTVVSFIAGLLPVLIFGAIGFFLFKGKWNGLNQYKQDSDSDDFIER